MLFRSVLVLSTYVAHVEGNLLDKAYKVVNLLATPLFGLFFMAMFIPWATGFGTWIGAIAGLAVVICVNFWKELTGLEGISFFWAMPLCFLAQAIVGPLASLIPVGRRGLRS